MPADFLKVAIFLLALAPPVLSPCVPTGSERGEQVLEGFVAVRLERTECFGPCPVYHVTIYADGVVTYEGTRYVVRTGTVSKTLPNSDVKRLVAALTAADVFSHRDQYASEEDGCESVVSCHPSAILTVVGWGRSKTIKHDYGCRAKFDDTDTHPRSLVELATVIDEIAGTQYWIGTLEERRDLYDRGEP